MNKEVELVRGLLHEKAKAIKYLWLVTRNF